MPVLPNMVVMAARGRDSFTAAQLAALEAAAGVTVHAVPQRLSRDEMQRLCAPAAILGFTRRAMPDFDARTLDGLPNLRALAVYATGSDWLDLQALKRRGIEVALLPDYSTLSVAEHTLGLMLTMSRRLHLSDRVARGDLPQGVSLRGFELFGKTVGVIGFGRIGRAVARLAQGLGMRVLAYDIAAKPFEPGVDMVGLGHLLTGSDVVVLACSRARGAPPLVGREMLGGMKPGAVLVNPSRSALVDNGAVLEAVVAGRLRGYAVDDTVFDAAQLARIEHGRILQSGHTAWYSDEAMVRGTQAWVEALVRLARGTRLSRTPEQSLASEHIGP